MAKGLPIQGLSFRCPHLGRRAGPHDSLVASFINEFDVALAQYPRELIYNMMKHAGLVLDPGVSSCLFFHLHTVECGQLYYWRKTTGTVTHDPLCYLMVLFVLPVWIPKARTEVVSLWGEVVKSNKKIFL